MNVTAPLRSATGSALAPNRRTRWRIASGSHLAVALGRKPGTAVPVPIVSGWFDVDSRTGEGVLSIQLGLAHGGRLRGVATRGASDIDGVRVWVVRGTLTAGNRNLPVVVALRDHGVTRRRGVWWWLSGTGHTRGCERRRSRWGSVLVADLLLTDG